MSAVAIIVGIVLGGLTGSFIGALAGLVGGFAAGWLIDQVSRQRRLIDNLEARLDVLEGRVGRAGQAPSEPSVVSPPEATALTAAEAAAAAPAPALEQRPPPALGEGRPKPLSPSLWSRLIAGNLAARIGVVILFFGVGFLLNYAIEQGLISVEVRLFGVCLGGVALAAIGWRQRLRRPMFGLSLQGGGIGILYLAVYAMLRLYELIGPGGAFVLFFGLGLASVFLAVAQNAQVLAVLGVSGAFLGPILASTGEGSHVVLFGYYALLNGVILAIDWFKAWRALNRTGFLFTFIIGLFWGARYYRPEFFSSVEPFLLLSFATYLAIPVLSALRRTEQQADGLVLLGTPLFVFALQAGMVYRYEYGMAWSAFGMGLAYLALAGALHRLRHGSGLLTESFLALGVVFMTLAVPYAFAAQPTTALWTLEGVGAVWFGLRQGRAAAWRFGMALQFVAAVYFLGHWPYRSLGVPVLNTLYISCLLVSVAALLTSYLLHRHARVLARDEGALSAAWLAWGLLWWFAAGVRELHLHLSSPDMPMAVLALFALSGAVLELAGERLKWAAPRHFLAVLIIAMALAAGELYGFADHPLENGGYLVWPLAFSVHYWALQRQEEAGLAAMVPLRHAAALWLLSVLAGWELAWLLKQVLPASPVWPLAAWGIVPGLALLLVSAAGQRIPWPIAAHHAGYAGAWTAPVAFFAIAWSLVANLISDGSPAPLPYAPLLNPLDVAQVLVLVALRRRAAELPKEGGGRLTVPLLTFVWASALVARTVHHWGGVPFDVHDLFHSWLFQASLSLVWTAMALAVMVHATRRGRRLSWLTGAFLLGLVAFKLFLVDLAGTGTVARIVSFIGVGLMFLAVGYLSPVPPAGDDGEEKG
jgi:uncharacterized membrane protein